MRTLTILHTCFSPAWGGLEIQALEMARALRARGHRVPLACTIGTRLAHEAASAGLHVLPLGVRGYVHPVAAGRLSAFLWESRTDIVHCQHSRDLATIIPACLLSGRRPPVILSKRMGSYIRKRDPLHRFTLTRVAAVLAVSEVIRRNVIDTTPVPADRVHTLHDAVDASLFAPGATEPALRRELGIPAGHPVIGIVGRFSPGKGHEDLLRAVRILLDRGRSMTLLVVGEASYGEEEVGRTLRALAGELGLDDVVRWTGFRTDVPAVMASLDILAFPSHAESFGVVLIEGMAAGRPVVSTNCDGVVDIVVDGETGIFVPPRTPQALADALDRLLGDVDLRTRLGAAGRKRVLERFDRGAATDRLEEVYAHALTGQPPSRR